MLCEIVCRVWGIIRIFAVLKGDTMVHEYSHEESEPLMVREPDMEYRTPSKRRYWVTPQEDVVPMSDIQPRAVSLKEVMKHSVTLDELDAHLTQTIHNYFHPNE